MQSSKVTTCALISIILALSAATAWASDPIGIYGIVEEVVFEPNENAPQRIQIRGAFALADRQRGDEYLRPERGYLYYTLTPGKEDICRKEWADLKAVAGTGQGIGFGFRYDTTTRLRKATDKLDAPDPYPIGVGLTRMGNHGHQARIIAGIKEALQSG
jgi:hypothetical protein